MRDNPLIGVLGPSKTEIEYLIAAFIAKMKKNFFMDQPEVVDLEKEKETET